MAQCLTFQTLRVIPACTTTFCSNAPVVTNVYTITNPQPINISSCVNVLGTPAEFSADIFNLSPAEGSQIGQAILIVWALAYAYRLIIKHIKESEIQNEIS